MNHNNWDVMGLKNSEDCILSQVYFIYRLILSVFKTNKKFFNDDFILYYFNIKWIFE